MRPVCNDCGAQLDGGLRDDTTVCPKCGRTWELSPDRQHINVTLEVHDVTHRATHIIGGDTSG